MKLFIKILTVILIFFVFYQSRWMFSFKYEPEYYENFFYESQYSYPKSARGISDGTLYKFVGYRLTQGENPFNINWEAPPFGKSLYGYSSRLLNNPYWFSVLCYFGVLFFLFKLFENSFTNKLAPFLGIMMLVLIPHFSNQVSDTMLDLPLMFFYVLNIYFLFDYINKKSLSSLAVSGLFLGISSAIKFPIYIPFIILSEAFVIYLNEKKWKRLFVYLSLIVLGYILGYFTYFIHHPNPIPWIRLHKKILDFYSSSQLSAQPFAAIKEIFNFGTWGYTYAIGLCAYIVAWYNYFKNKENLKLLTILLFSTVYLVVNSFISFYPRYLLPLSFTFIYLIFFVTKVNVKVILFICLISVPFFYKAFIPFNPSGDAQAMARFMETRAYRELYRSINPKTINNGKETDFIVGMESFNSEIDVRKIKVNIKNETKVGNKYHYDLYVEYYSKFGIIDNNIPIEYELVNGQWKLNWSWDYVYKDYLPNAKINFKHLPVKLTRVYEVYVIPRLMYDWNKNLDKLSRLTGRPRVDINNMLQQIVPNDFERFVGYLHEDIKELERNELLKDNGVVRVREVILDLDLESKPNTIVITI